MSLSPPRYKQYFSKDLGHGHSYAIGWDVTTSKLAIEIDGTIIARISASGITSNPVFSGDAQGNIQIRGASAWESVAVSGDITLTSAGVASIGAGKVLSAMLAANLVQVATGTITSADIVATGAGKFGHANGYPVVAAVGAHNAPEFISAVLIYDYAGAAYGAGGNITVNLSGGGAAQSDLVAAADFCGAGSDKLVVMRPPTAAAAIPLVENAGLNLVAAAAFTLGSATGVIRYAVMYRVHATGL